MSCLLFAQRPGGPELTCSARDACVGILKGSYWEGELWRAVRKLAAFSASAFADIQIQAIKTRRSGKWRLFSYDVVC
ncbi:hypothetical protein LFE_0533 [Leptospirillum ferrooxidans C2-3]|uniref:Uncharacterized protein n=1 Tax=Leptospirillum ferrooxidans (strain C2-3) TaxID=1162668 RepID=I0ILV0_LEPFC|nr:hypothetical protein LFE_0533 [Leptospirillum ferrooxidans C2-3]